MSIMSFAQRYKCFCQWKLQLLFCSWNDSFSVSAKFAFLFSAHLGASSIGSLYAINFLYTDFLSLLLGLTPSSFQYTFYPETSSVFVKTLEHFVTWKLGPFMSVCFSSHMFWQLRCLFVSGELRQQTVDIQTQLQSATVASTTNWRVFTTTTVCTFGTWPTSRKSARWDRSCFTVVLFGVLMWVCQCYHC